MKKKKGILHKTLAMLLSGVMICNTLSIPMETAYAEEVVSVHEHEEEIGAEEEVMLAADVILDGQEDVILDSETVPNDAESPPDGLADLEIVPVEMETDLSKPETVPTESIGEDTETPTEAEITEPEIVGESETENTPTEPVSESETIPEETENATEGENTETTAPAYTAEEVKAMIDALPSVSELENMSEDELNSVYEQAREAYDAFEALTDEEQIELADDLVKLRDVMDYFSITVVPLASSVSAVTKIAIAADPDKANNAKNKLSGYKIDDQDLNENAKGDYIYLGYKKETATSGFITGILFYQTSNQSESIAESRTYGGHTYYLLGSTSEPNDGGGVINLNNGTGKNDPRIYMYITRDVTLKPLTSVYTSTGKDNSSGACVNTNGDAQDLNKGAGGEYIWLKTNMVYSSNYSSTWSSDATYHWHALNGAPTYVQDKAAHTWSNGKCSVCSYSCKHSKYSNGKCTTCGVVHSNHTWKNGNCSVCGIAHTGHTWKNGTCSACGIAHTGHTWKNGTCSVCSLVCSHTWSSGKCSVCSIAHTGHIWEDGSCSVCGLSCDHSWNNGICTTCGFVCSHSWKNGRCKICGVECSHSWSYNGCTICGVKCSHTFQNHICKKCSCTDLTYIDRVWNSSTNKLDVSTKNVNAPVTVVTASTSTLTSGWYIVKDNISRAGITISGTVHLVLCDGVSLNLTSALNLASGNTLYIYAQSDDINTMGSLTAKGNSYYAGIGAGFNRNTAGTLIINGGVITATGGDFGAGIGSGRINHTYDYGYASYGATVTINGGIVTAKGGKGGTGIGYGNNNGAGGSVTINGGTVTAIAGSMWENPTYAIGATVTINGGNIKASSIGGREGYSIIKNSAGTVVTLKTYTLDGVTAQKRVGSVEGVSYGANFYTLDTNKIYAYIPSNGNITKATIQSGQIFGPKSSGDTTLYCTHAALENGFCRYCGAYVNGSTVYTAPETQEGVCLIYNPNDLLWFAAYVNSKNSSASAKLMDDINMSGVSWSGIGTSSSNFTGTFDGNGNKVTLKFSGSAEYLSMFPYVSGATIQNLTVDGTIDTSYHFVASVIGRVTGGTVTLQNCLSTVTINSSYNGDGTHGGLVSIVASGTLNIQNCGFAGKIIGTKTTYCGGMVGWTDKSAKTNISNSYVAAEFNLEDNSGNTFGRNPNYVSLTNCYYLNALSDPSVATKMSAESFRSGEVAWLLNNKSASGMWKQTIGSDSYPNFSGGTVYFGYKDCGDDGSYSNSELNTDKPNHAEFDGKGFCTTCDGYQPAVLNNGLYEISNAGQLFWFAEFVNTGNNKVSAVLTADIDLENRVWTPIGLYTDDPSATSRNTPFYGTFDGQYHMISNLNVDMSENNYETGQFSRVATGGVLKNFGVVNATVTQNSSGHEDKGVRTGVIAGEIFNGTVSNVFTAGSLSISTAHEQKGGIAGECASSRLTSCYTTYGILTTKVSVESYVPTITRCYYKADEVNNSSYGENMTEAQFKSGEVTYKLNNGVTDSTQIWYQTIGKDDYPKFSGSPVYYHESSKEYSNEKDIASVTIEWKDMNFSYSKGTWDTDTMTWEGGGWEADEGCGTVTVTNTGTMDVNAIFGVSYTGGVNTYDISVSFFEGNKALPEGRLKIARNEERMVAVKLTGDEPSKYIETAKTIGQITITLSTE